jgi:hypothetical protein
MALIFQLREAGFKKERDLSQVTQPVLTDLRVFLGLKLQLILLPGKNPTAECPVKCSDSF